MVNTLGLILFTVLLAIGQVAFKKIGTSIHGDSVMAALAAMLRSPLLYVALAIYAVATLLWIFLLSRVPLSQAYPWVAVTIFIVSLLGWWLFHERPSPIFWLGLLLVMAGIVLTQYGSGKL